MSDAVEQLNWGRDRTVAIETLVTLLDGGVVPKEAEIVTRAAGLIGVSLADVKRAWTARMNRLRLVPQEPAPQVRARVEKKNPVPGKRLCAQCDQLLLTKNFGWKDKDHRWLRWMCKQCFKEYQRKRYLSSAEIDRLGKVLKFVLQEGDAHAGTPCVDCGVPCSIGEEVFASDAVLRHARHDPKSSTDQE